MDFSNNNISSLVILGTDIPSSKLNDSKIENINGLKVDIIRFCELNIENINRYDVAFFMNPKTDQQEFTKIPGKNKKKEKEVLFCFYIVNENQKMAKNLRYNESIIITEEKNEIETMLTLIYTIYFEHMISIDLHDLINIFGGKYFKKTTVSISDIYSLGRLLNKLKPKIKQNIKSSYRNFVHISFPNGQKYKLSDIESIMNIYNLAMENCPSIYFSDTLVHDIVSIKLDIFFEHQVSRYP
ncbi:hypothetical protein [Desulfohalobium retbaense]|uniref:Uncharacterized protein n=1 Tax=Desulfohalobium retbaense (strain ATCC 49708 / DSM 5692 / JCM 16813 / HR100) TaxID=485915 RepID=C8X5W3_DESRD|nr:hypothetical protein [Desulfohalobium retbaense]ACV69810.1 hypothetical protein Dret_2532 [Desulfohalobium retbaense DSM 5692]